MLKKVKDNLEVIAWFFWLLTHKEELDEICKEIEEAGKCFQKMTNALQGEKTYEMHDVQGKAQDSER